VAHARIASDFRGGPFAVWHGSGYVEAGKSLLAGRGLLQQGKYAAAAAELRRALEAGSESETVFLLTAKSYLLAGDYEHARLLLNGRAKYEASGALFNDVQKIWERAVAANDLSAEAAQLAREGKLADAATKARAAATLYPEMAGLDANAKSLEGQAALTDGPAPDAAAAPIAVPAPAAPRRRHR
jgi:thioredoxin-like negative regulator of GroEL